MEGPPVKAVPESVSRRSTPQSVPFEAVPDNAAPDPPTEVDVGKKDAKPHLEFDANHAWNPRERVIIREMKCYLTKVSPEILVDVGELELYLLWPTDVTGIVDVLEGNLVADIWKYAIMRGTIESNYHELQEIIECTNMKQKGVLTTME